MNDQKQKLEVLGIALLIAQSQHDTKLESLPTPTDKTRAEKVENTLLQDTIRNAKKLWKFVNSDDAKDNTPLPTEIQHD